jgi:hypothetical protein
MESRTKQLVATARIQGYSWGDIAQTLSIPEGTLKYYVKGVIKPAFKDSELYKQYLSEEQFPTSKSKEEESIPKVVNLLTESEVDLLKEALKDRDLYKQCLSKESLPTSKSKEEQSLPKVVNLLTESEVDLLKELTPNSTRKLIGEFLALLLNVRFNPLVTDVEQEMADSRIKLVYVLLHEYLQRKQQV